MSKKIVNTIEWVTIIGWTAVSVMFIHGLTKYCDEIRKAYGVETCEEMLAIMTQNIKDKQEIRRKSTEQ